MRVCVLFKCNYFSSLIGSVAGERLTASLFLQLSCLVLYLNKLPAWVDFVISLTIGLLVAALVQLVVVRRLKKSFRSAESEFC